MQDALCDGAELALLGLGERVEDQAAHLVDVGGCGTGNRVLARVGEGGQGVAAVGGVRAAPDPAALSKRPTTLDSRESVLPV